MNPLFRNSYRALTDAARREASADELATTLSNTRRTLGASSLARYSQSSLSSLRSRIVSSVMRQLGPIGSVISALLRPSGKTLTDDIQSEIAAAANLLTQFGQQIAPPGGGPPRKTQAATGADDGQPPRRVSSAPIGPSQDDDRNISVIVGRRERRFSTDDPIMTGEMIPVTSSNVHSIGFIWNPDNPTRGTLRVRFLKKLRGGGTKPGASYNYEGVHPDVFAAFQVAASKGEFVWDELRVRGTVSGHQYSYDLAGTDDGGYIPRQAGLKRGQQGEFYMQRKFQGRTSSLPEQQVRGPRAALVEEFQQRAGQMNFMPDRGSPNRGSPRRGR